MTTENTGTAAVNGEQQPQDNATDNAQNSPQDAQKPQSESSVPYARFKEVVDAKKAAEDSLADVAQAMVDGLPEEYRDLVPDLCPAAKIKWISAATAKGVFFAKPSEPDSPGSKRPGAKPPTDFSGLSPREIIRAGYGQ